MKMHDTVKEHAIGIVKRLDDAGFKALFAGGAVRDMVLGVEPKDYDIVTNASLEDIERLFDHIIPVGKQFGVCRVIVEGVPFEVAEFRKDGVYEDGRRPLSIETADEVEDTQRRDFTINALLYDPIRDEILDYVDGVNDIKRRVLRTVGEPDERFDEDRLRMLRAIRFAARLSLSIETSTERSIRELAPAVLSVSAERIGEELSKVVSGPNAGRGLRLLDETGLLRVVLPEVNALKGVDQPPQFHPEGDVFKHTCLMLDMFNEGTETLAFGILMHDIAKPETYTVSDRIRFTRHEAVGEEMAGRILKRLCLSNATVSRVQWLVRSHMKFVNVKKMKRSKLLRFILDDGIGELLELHRLDCLSSHNRLDNYDFVKQVLSEEKTNNQKLALPTPLITGKDLIELGYEPGPAFGIMLRSVEDKQLDGELVSRKAAIDFVQREFSQQDNPHPPI
ncbi:CCA tRNA nucleotidyltransferase [Candidatus Latescibacterota bacterium]